MEKVLSIGINRRANDCDENIHMLKFAEIGQEVQVVNVMPLHNIGNLPSGRQRTNQIFKQAITNKRSDTKNIQNDICVPALYSLASHFPDMCLAKPEDQRLLKNLMMFLEVEIAKRKKFEVEVQLKGKEFSELILKNEKEIVTLKEGNEMLKQQNILLSSHLDGYKEKISNSESQLIKVEVEASSLKKQVIGYERVIKRLQEDLQEKEDALNKRLNDREMDKKRFKTKIVQTAEKMSQQMEMKLTDQIRKLEMEMKHKDKKMQRVKQLLSSDMPLITPHSALAPSSYDLIGKSTESLLTSTSIPSTITTRKKTTYKTPPIPYRTQALAVSNPRHRRSRSVSDKRWLEHRPQAPVPLNTVMQPKIKKRKSITKLTDMKFVANSKTSKYCLLTQQQDSEGDLETHLYKGDVVPTCGGGAQVILNDVEILKQKSPSSSPTQKRCGNAITPNTGDKCSISIEGHRYNKRLKH